MMKIKSFPVFVVLLFILNVVLFSCCDGNYNKELLLIDSLIDKNDFDAALSKISAIDTNMFDNKNKAYFFLLKTQTEYKNYIPATSDKYINYAVDYYSKSTDEERYTRALIYQGCVNEELGNLEKAVECYHKVEKNTTNKKDLAYTKLRLGYLYQSQIVGADSIALQKFLESYDLYQNLNDKHYMLLCLGEIGILYRDRKLKNDSAIYYINEAIALADSLQDSYLEFVNYNSRAEYYCYIKEDYQKSKTDALYAINKGGDEIDHPRAHFCLSLSYLKLGSLDSCLYYIQNAPSMVSSADSVTYYGLLSEIDRQNQDVNGALKNHDIAENIADSILIHSLNHRLLAVEKKYDTQKVELEKAKLGSKLKTSLLTGAVVTILSLVLILILIRYRQKLKMKEMENELINADLASSLENLNKMQGTIESYDKELNKAKQDYFEAITASESQVSNLKRKIEEANRSIALSEKEHLLAITESESQVSKLKGEIDEANRLIALNLKERDNLNNQIQELETKEKQSDEIKSMIKEQITIVRELLNSSYIHNESENFAKKFNSFMALPGRTNGRKEKSYWISLQTVTNDFFDNILVKAQLLADGKLNDTDINYLALCCWDFSRSGIMICLRYKSLASVSNKKVDIAKKLKVKNVDEFLTLYRDKKENI